MNIIDKLGALIYNKHVWYDPAQNPQARASIFLLSGTNISFLFMFLFFRIAWGWYEGSNSVIFCFFMYNSVLIITKRVRKINVAYQFTLYIVILNLFALCYFNGGLFKSSFSLYYLIVLQIATSVGRRFLLRYILIVAGWFLFWFILEKCGIIHFTNTLPVEYHRTLMIINIIFFLFLFLIVLYARLMEVEGNETNSLNAQSLKYEKKLEKAVKRNVLEAITNTEEKERKRVAADLHDSIGPLLSSVKMSMGAMSLASGEDRKKMLDTSMEIINEAIRDVRQISHNMMPIPIQKEGMYSAVAQLLKRFDQPGGLKTHLKHPTEKPKYNPASSAILYRAIEELINNTIKHAQAKNIYLDFSEDEEELRVIYKDDGKGFDVDKAMTKAKGLGLKNVNDRILTLNGSVEFDGSNGFKAEILVLI